MIVLVYGYEGSGEGHWQRLLESELANRGIPHEFPTLSSPLEPEKDQWVAELGACVDAAGNEPVTFVAHSLGCWAVDHFVAERGVSRLRGALLVAPPSPYLLFEAVQSFLPPPMRKDAWAPIAGRSLLIGSDDDDYASSKEHAEIASSLGLRCEHLSGAKHVNAESGYGSWARPIEWLAEIGAIPSA